MSREKRLSRFARIEFHLSSVFCRRESGKTEHTETGGGERLRQNEPKPKTTKSNETESNEADSYEAALDGVETEKADTQADSV